MQHQKVNSIQNSREILAIASLEAEASHDSCGNECNGQQSLSTACKDQTWPMSTDHSQRALSTACKNWAQPVSTDHSQRALSVAIDHWAQPASTEHSQGAPSTASEHWAQPGSTEHSQGALSTASVPAHWFLHHHDGNLFPEFNMWSALVTGVTFHHSCEGK